MPEIEIGDDGEISPEILNQFPRAAIPPLEIPHYLVVLLLTRINTNAYALEHRYGKFFPLWLFFCALYGRFLLGFSSLKLYRFCPGSIVIAILILFWLSVHDSETLFPQVHLPRHIIPVTLSAGIILLLAFSLVNNNSSNKPSSSSVANTQPTPLNIELLTRCLYNTGSLGVAVMENLDNFYGKVVATIPRGEKVYIMYDDFGGYRVWTGKRLGWVSDNSYRIEERPCNEEQPGN